VTALQCAVVQRLHVTAHERHVHQGDVLVHGGHVLAGRAGPRGPVLKRGVEQAVVGDLGFTALALAAFGVASHQVHARVDTGVGRFQDRRPRGFVAGGVGQAHALVVAEHDRMAGFVALLDHGLALRVEHRVAVLVELGPIDQDAGVLAVGESAPGVTGRVKTQHGRVDGLTGEAQRVGEAAFPGGHGLLGAVEQVAVLDALLRVLEHVGAVGDVPVAVDHRFHHHHGALLERLTVVTKRRTPSYRTNGPCSRARPYCIEGARCRAPLGQ
jgi:hypothetical protein